MFDLNASENSFVSLDGDYSETPNIGDAEKKCMGECGKRCDKCGLRNCVGEPNHRGPHRCRFC